MKDAKKSTNIHIREHSKHSSRAESSKLKPMGPVNHDSRNSKRTTVTKVELPLELKRQFIEAENLTEEEQLRIKKEAHKKANNKMKSTENKIQNDMISMLESQCNKLGGQVERQKLENTKLRFEIGQLRKNIEFMSKKLENIYIDNEKLMRNNDCGTMQKGQLSEQLNKMRSAYQRLYEQNQQYKAKYECQIKALKNALQQQNYRSATLQQKINELTDEKIEVEEQLRDKQQQYEYLKSKFEQKKRQWDIKQQELESYTKQNLDRKGQKITKFQVQIQNLTDKLKQEELIRKKVTDKNQDLLKEAGKRNDFIRDLEDQISGLKKRVNDLSILKSSNNAIMNQKLQQLNEQNTKLKKNIEHLQKRGVIIEEQVSKPVLFGTQDDY